MGDAWARQSGLHGWTASSCRPMWRGPRARRRARSSCAGDLRGQRPHPAGRRRFCGGRLPGDRAGAVRPHPARHRARLRRERDPGRHRAKGQSSTENALADIAAAAGLCQGGRQGRRDRLLLGRLSRLGLGDAPSRLRRRGRPTTAAASARSRRSSRDARC